MTYFPENLYMNSLPFVPVGEIPQSMSAQLRTLKVDGTGSVTAQPDIAIAVLGVTTEDASLAVAQAENTQLITAVLNTLQQMGVAANDIATLSYTITPQYDYVEGQQIFRGYQVQHTLKVTIRDITKVGAIIDAAVASGANFVTDISFTVTNPTIYYLQALNLAIENAITKAMSIGRQFNLQVNPIPVRIVEETFEVTPNQPVALKTAEATPIQPGEIRISASVDIVFSYNF